MTGEPASALPGVLRGVVVLDQPHRLARRGEVAPPTAQPAVAAPVAPPRGYEEGLRAGYEQGLAAGRAQQSEQDEARWRRGIDEARAQAAQEGHAEGLRRAAQDAEAALARERAELVQDAHAMLQQHVQRLQQLVAAVAAQSERAAAQAEDDLVALAFEAVCRVLGAHAVEPGVLRAMVRELMAQRRDGEPLSVHVHPDDHAWLQRLDLTDAAWTWVADEGVQLGGVLLRWPHGALDARLETQLQSLRHALLAAREARRAGLPAAGEDA